MATRKQIAAARRNLRKARAARRKKRKGRTRGVGQWGYPESAFAPGRR